MGCLRVLLLLCTQRAVIITYPSVIMLRLSSSASTSVMGTAWERMRRSKEPTPSLDTPADTSPSPNRKKSVECCEPQSDAQGVGERERVRRKCTHKHTRKHTLQKATSCTLSPAVLGPVLVVRVPVDYSCHRSYHCHHCSHHRHRLQSQN